MFGMNTVSLHVISDVAVLKKYYLELAKSLPEDYMTTLGKVFESGKFEEEQVCNIANFVSCPTPEESNKKLLDWFIMSMNEENILEFCDLLENIINPTMEAAVHALRNGMMHKTQLIYQTHLIYLYITVVYLKISIFLICHS